MSQKSTSRNIFHFWRPGALCCLWRRKFLLPYTTIYWCSPRENWFPWETDPLSRTGTGGGVSSLSRLLQVCTDRSVCVYHEMQNFEGGTSKGLALGAPQLANETRPSGNFPRDLHLSFLLVLLYTYPLLTKPYFCLLFGFLLQLFKPFYNSLWN